MAVETLPGSPFEVIEAKLLFQLLMGLLANPSCLDGGRQGTQTGRCGQIGEIVFLSPELRCSPISQAQMLLALSLIRCGGPSAVRTRTAAKRALSLPFVPVRQLTVCHLAPASMSSAGIDRISGTCRRRGRPRLATGQSRRTSTGYTFR